MKLFTLLENTAICDTLRAEHGLSLYIEACGHRILFDSGQSDAFTSNARQMNVDLSTVDIAILSHGHYDHGGGLHAFTHQNDHAPIYIHEKAFGRFFNMRGTYIGLDNTLAACDRLDYVNGTVALADGLTLTDCNDRDFAVCLNSYGLVKQTGDKLVPDDFVHEQYLLIEEGGKRVLVSGCSHKGILNLVDWFRPDILIGGFHFKSETDRTVLEHASHQLLQYDTLYYTGHCTGEEQYQYMKQIMGDRLNIIRTGTILEF